MLRFGDAGNKNIPSEPLRKKGCSNKLKISPKSISWLINISTQTPVCYTIKCK